MSMFATTDRFHITGDWYAVLPLEATSGQLEFFFLLKNRLGFSEGGLAAAASGDAAAKPRARTRRGKKPADAKAKTKTLTAEEAAAQVGANQLLVAILAQQIEKRTGEDTYEPLPTEMWPPLTSVENIEKRRGVVRQIPASAMARLTHQAAARMFLDEDTQKNSDEPSGSSTSSAAPPAS